MIYICILKGCGTMWDSDVGKKICDDILIQVLLEKDIVHGLCQHVCHIFIQHGRFLIRSLPCKVHWLRMCLILWMQSENIFWYFRSTKGASGLLCPECCLLDCFDCGLLCLTGLKKGRHAQKGTSCWVMPLVDKYDECGYFSTVVTWAQEVLKELPCP